MKKRFLFLFILVLALGLAFGLGGGRVLAQTGPQQAIKLATSVELPIQGRLLSASGVPVNGIVNVGFRLYSAATAGTLYCEDLHAVTVADGLYATTLQCPRQYLDGRDLYLAVKLEGDDEMTPRQKILPAAYAVAFLPGAFVQDTAGSGPVLALAGTNPGLPGAFYVINGDAEGIAAWFDNSSASEAALIVRNLDSDGPLFTGFSGSDADYDFQIGDYGSIESNAGSYLTYPGSDIHINSSCANIYYLSDGSLRINTTSAPCSFSALLSIETPLQLYGTPITVNHFTFYMYASSLNAYIDAVQVYLQNPSSGTPYLMASSDGNYTSPGLYLNYTIQATSSNVLHAGYGPITLKFDCQLDNNGIILDLRSVMVSFSHLMPTP